MKFSQRIGKKSVRESIQIDSIDEILENKLWNCILTDFLNCSNRAYYNTVSDEVLFSKSVWQDFFEQRIDEIPSFTSGGIYFDGVVEHIKKWFFQSKWYEKYDLLEFISNFCENSYNYQFIEKCNEVLERESSGYRIVGQKVISITSEEEIGAIEEAISSSLKSKTVEIHLRTSLEYLSNRNNPDYRNSIKESISAVESFCVIITGDPSTTLGKALAKIEKEYKIHGALKTAFTSLYGYTSDSGGIRHSLLEDDIEVTMEDAKFMLVSCSAFINYLKVKTSI